MNAKDRQAPLTDLEKKLQIELLKADLEGCIKRAKKAEQEAKAAARKENQIRAERKRLTEKLSKLLGE